MEAAGPGLENQYVETQAKTERIYMSESPKMHDTRPNLDTPSSSVQG